MDDLYIVVRQKPHVVGNTQMVYWTRYPETALVGSPARFRRKLNLFCVMTLEEATKHCGYDTRAYPPLTPEEARTVRKYLATQEG